MPTFATEAASSALRSVEQGAGNPWCFSLPEGKLSQEATQQKKTKRIEEDTGRLRAPCLFAQVAYTGLSLGRA